MKNAPPQTLQPRDFTVNRTWLAYRINQAPMLAEGEDIDLYVLQDAGSMFLFGNAFAPAGSDHPADNVAEKLLLSAHAKRNTWPDELLLPGMPAPDNSFARIARQHGVAVRHVPESQLSFYIKDTQEAYEDFLGRPSDDD